MASFRKEDLARNSDLGSPFLPWMAFMIILQPAVLCFLFLLFLMPQIFEQALVGSIQDPKEVSACTDSHAVLGLK